MGLLKWLFGLFCVFYFFATIIVKTPAQWAAWFALESAPGLSLSGVSGSLWKGKAANAQLQIERESLQFGSITWQVKPLSLLSLSPCAFLTSQNVTGELCASPNGNFKAKQLLVDQVPANLFERLVGVQLGGTGSATINQAKFDQMFVVDTISGNLTWQNARLNIGDGWHALGSFAADITESGNGGIKAQLTTIEGELDVDIQAELNHGMTPQLQGVIRPSPKASDQIVQGLSLFTQGQDDGSFLVSFPGG